MEVSSWFRLGFHRHTKTLEGIVHQTVEDVRQQRSIQSVSPVRSCLWVSVGQRYCDRVGFELVCVDEFQ